MPFTLLFDLDGTLVDTDPLHFQAYLELLAGEDEPPIDLDFYRTRIMGFGHADIFTMLFPEAGETRRRQLSEEKERTFRRLLRDRVIEPRGGLSELLAWARARGYRCGIVTNAPRDNAALILEALRLGDRFDTVVFGEELPLPKPDPLPYATGLARLGGRAEAAIAFEDSLSGVRSAAAARIFTVGIHAALPPPVLRQAGAAYTIADFQDAGLWAELARRTAASVCTTTHFPSPSKESES
jgi:beta-phosphoglucomutase